MPPLALAGFSGGARTCIGKHLGKLKAKIGLIKFLKRYEKIELPDQPLEFIGILYQPKDFTTKLVKGQ